MTKGNHMTQEALKLTLDALEEIALAGMSVAPEMLDEKEAFHARQAWRFIGIAARALESVKKARAEQPERDELQAKGEHPAPCARHCEATAFQIVIKNLQAQLAQPEQGGKTGWPAGMLQDDSRELSKALASKPDAKQHAREAAHGIKGEA